MAKQKQTVEYSDTSGNRWEAEEGGPSGCFTLPGSEVQFSLRGFVQWAERTLPRAKTLGDVKVLDEGFANFEDVWVSAGGKEAQEKATTTKAKSKAASTESKSTALVSSEDEKFKTLAKHLKGKEATKSELLEALPFKEFTLEKLLKDPRIKKAGKKGTSFLYALA